MSCNITGYVSLSPPLHFLIYADGLEGDDEPLLNISTWHYEFGNIIVYYSDGVRWTEHAAPMSEPPVAILATTRSKLGLKEGKVSCNYICRY
jgi:hypothetical protein